MRKLLIWLIAVLVLHLSACSSPPPGPASDTLRVGILPDEDEQTLRDRYAPLLDFVSHATGLSFELIIPGDYQDLLERFGKGEIDLAYLGGATFVMAHSEYGALPLVMRDVDSRFTSWMVVAGNSDASFKQLRDKRFSFGSRLSTSGHLMPRHFLRELQQLDPETFFHSVRYSGQHDRTAYWVRDGEVDAGVVNSEIVRKMFADGRLQAGDIRIIWETPPFPDYVWAAHPRLATEIREQIQQAFLQLSVDNPQHQAVLSNLGSAGFFPATPGDSSSRKISLARSVTCCKRPGLTLPFWSWSLPRVL